MYDILFTRKAMKQFEKLEPEQQERVNAAIERIRIRPHTHIKKLVGNPYYRLRVGDYRIILDIHEQTVTILILAIGHRKNIYTKEL